MATAMSCWPWPARRPPMWATCSNKARVRGCSFGPRCQSSFLRTTGRNSCGRFHRTRNEFYRNERIEEIAEQRLQEFEGKLGRPLSIPVDIELFGDLVLGLSMLWENIDELPGEEVLAGLRPADRLIVMNERRKLEMQQQAGRRR